MSGSGREKVRYGFAVCGVRGGGDPPRAHLHASFRTISHLMVFRDTTQ